MTKSELIKMISMFKTEVLPKAISRQDISVPKKVVAKKKN